MITWFQGLPLWLQAAAIIIGGLATVTLIATVDTWWWGHK